jgi:acetyltransferase-like isoleucine patch superfamily enzyme
MSRFPGGRALGRLRGTEPRFYGVDVTIGEGVRFGRNVVFNSSRVRIGDGVSIGDNVRVDSESFEIGDFGTIYPDCFFPGPGSIVIGHNFWLGRTSIVDSMGGTTVGNNVGVGPHSQLWTHMVYGDVLYGCRFHSSRSLEIGDDVWFVGHCLVSPIRAGDRSLAMLGSVVTKDMEADHSYAGSPARDITDRIGPQFAPRPIEERSALLRGKIDEFAADRGRAPETVAIVVSTWDEQMDSEVTVFNVSDRTYTKCGTPIERALMHALLPDAKFVPRQA